MSHEPPPPPETGQIVNGYRWDGQQWLPLPQGAPPPPGSGVGAVVDPPPGKGKKPFYKRWWVWAVGIVVVIIVIAVSSGSTSSNAPGAKSQTPSPTLTSSAGNTIVTKAITPTGSAPAGGATAAVPDSQQLVASAPQQSTLIDEMNKQYGTFAPVSKSGSGDSTIALPTGSKAGMVTASYKGSSNFSITVLDAGNQSTGDLLVNTIGAYEGVSAYGLSSFGDGVKLKITGSGAWQIAIAPLSAAPTMKFPVSGKGDAVYLYGGKAEDWTITNTGKSNFVVTQYADFPNLLINEIGSYSGTVPANDGPTVVTIKSDGNWAIKGP